MSRPKLEWSPSPRWEPNRKSRAKEHMPTAREGRPCVPKHLTAQERQRFRQLSAGLEMRRSLTPQDGEILALYCVTWSRWRRCLDDITKRGEVIEVEVRDKDNNTIFREKKNPYCLIAQECERQMHCYLQSLGMTPQSREKVKPVKPDEKNVPFEPGTVGFILEQQEREENDRAN